MPQYKQLPLVIPYYTNGLFYFNEISLKTNPWGELSEIIRKQGSQNPLCISEPEKHFDELFALCCEQLSIPFSIGTIYNLSWTLNFISNISSDCLVCTTSVWHFLSLQSQAQEVLPRIKTLILIETDSSTQKEEIAKYLPYADIFYISNPYDKH